jgi:hypothetical protein
MAWPNWRREEQYPSKKSPIERWFWEFLRRNEQYQKDFDELIKSPHSGYYIGNIDDGEKSIIEVNSPINGKSFRGENNTVLYIWRSRLEIFTNTWRLPLRQDDWESFNPEAPFLGQATFKTSMEDRTSPISLTGKDIKRIFNTKPEEKYEQHFYSDSDLYIHVDPHLPLDICLEKVRKVLELHRKSVFDGKKSYRFRPDEQAQALRLYDAKKEPSLDEMAEIMGMEDVENRDEKIVLYRAQDRIKSVSKYIENPSIILDMHTGKKKF